MKANSITLVDHGTILTMDKNRRIIEDGAILIAGDKILAVGESAKVRKQTKADRIIDGRGKIVLPGFIDGHDHADQTFYRTLAYDLPFAVWDRRYMFKTAKFAQERDYYYAGLISYIELLKSGATTTVTEHYYHTSWRNFDNLAEAARDIGMRACLGFGVMDRSHYDYVGIEAKELLREFGRAHEEWNGKGNGRIHIWISPTGFGNTSDDALKGCVATAKKYGTRLTIHVAGTWTAASNPMWDYLKGETEHLNDLGILGPSTLAAHCVWLTEDDLQTFKETKTSVVHNPISNMYLAFGVSPVNRMIRLGIPVSLGTDGIGSNTRDMFEVMRAAAYLQKIHTMDTLSITANKILEMATIEGARALGLDEKIGSLEAGKKADLVVIDIEKAHITPYRNPIPAVVYCAKKSDVETVIVNGNIVVENGTLRTMNEGEVISEARQRIGAFWKRGDFK